MLGEGEIPAVDMLHGRESKKQMLEIKVREIRGKCPVYKVGDKIVIDDPRILLNRTDALCTHALSTLLHYVTILEHD
ncbi:hypothetical protein ES703_97714 [subsurface metagenome]